MEKIIPTHVLNSAKVVAVFLGIYSMGISPSWAGNVVIDAAALVHWGKETRSMSPGEIRLNITVSGTVTDEKGAPLPGVTVSVPETTIGIATDLDGKYLISVPEGSTLVFSFIGFQTQRIPVGDRSVIDVVLIEDMASLDEVVVVGYGSVKKS